MENMINTIQPDDIKAAMEGLNSGKKTLSEWIGSAMAKAAFKDTPGYRWFFWPTGPSPIAPLGGLMEKPEALEKLADRFELGPDIAIALSAPMKGINAVEGIITPADNELAIMGIPSDMDPQIGGLEFIAAAAHTVQMTPPQPLASWVRDALLLVGCDRNFDAPDGIWDIKISPMGEGGGDIDYWTFLSKVVKNIPPDENIPARMKCDDFATQTIDSPALAQWVKDNID